MGFVRVLLAVSVLVAHTGAIFGARFFGGGVIAVQCFFVISGFYMSLVLNGKYQRLTDFYFNRALRIYPLYWMVLIAYFAAAIPYRKITGNWLGVIGGVPGDLTPVEIASAGLINVGIFGSDYIHFVPLRDGIRMSQLLAVPVVWSLAVELTFYAVVPFLNRLTTAALSVLCISGFVARAVISYAHDGWTDWNYYFGPSELPFFIIGMLAHRYHRAFVNGRLRRSGIVLVTSALWCVLCCFYANLGLTYEERWIVLGSFPFLLPYLFELTKSSAIDRRISTWSYPLYLVHSLVLSLYSPLRHFIPAEYQSLSVLALSVIGSGIAIRFEARIERRLKRVPDERSARARETAVEVPVPQPATT